MIAFLARIRAFFLSSTPKTPPPPKKPAKPTRPPTKPPKRGLVAQVAAVRTQAIGASVVLRLVEVPASAAARDRARLAQYLEIAASRLRDARAALDAALSMAQWIADCQLLDQVDAIRADLQSQARRDLPFQEDRIATSGGPVQPPADTGKGPTPGPAVAVAAAACGSDGAVVAAGAGAVSGRGGEVPGSEPVRPGRFALPLRPAVPRFDAELLGRGPLYDALPTQVCGVAEYGSTR